MAMAWAMRATQCNNTPIGGWNREVISLAKSSEAGLLNTSLMTGPLPDELKGIAR